MTTALVRYDAACQAVAAAKSVDEVQEIRAQADALRAYSKQAKNRQLEVDAAEIRIRAERRLGELMAEQGQMVGKASGAKGIGTSAGYNSTRTQPGTPATLAEAGIDKNLAHRARTYAAVPSEQFEQLLTNKRKQESRRVVLDPEFQAEAEAAARDLEIERDERIALAGAGELFTENDKLIKQVSGLTRRVSGLLEEVSSLKQQVKIWKDRAIGAGWEGRPNA
jgi:hypothetical protein